MQISAPRLTRITIVLLLLAGCVAHRTPAIPTTPWPAAASIDAFIAANDADTDYKFTGFVLLAQKGHALYQRGFGEISRDAKRKFARLPNVDTTFRIGSVTKTFTAAAIMLLIRDKKLALDQTLDSLAIGAPTQYAGVTILQLLSHTSGIHDFTNLPNYNDFKNKRLSSQELLAIIWPSNADFTPGEKYQYSNSGYVILGAVIEKLTGRPFAEFFQQRLFAPAGMTRTFVGDAGAPNMAVGYSEAAEADAISMTVPHAAGSMRSTARDLLAWHTFLQGDFFSAAEKLLLYTPVKANYGLGWMTSDVGNGKTAIGHGGGIDGFVTSFLRLPDDDVVAIVLCNSTDNDPETVAMAMLQTYLGHPPTIAPVVATTPYDEVKAKPLQGSYAMTAASKAELAGAPPEVLAQIAVIEVSAQAAGLMIKPVGQPSQPLISYADGSYRNRKLKIVVNFAIDATGVTTMVLQQLATVIRYQREP